MSFERTVDTQNRFEAALHADGWEWMLLEIMGHRTRWGRARLEERYGVKMLRIDVPVDGDPNANGWTTHYYGGPAIFSITLSDEAMCLARNKPFEPPSRLRLESRADPADAEFSEIDESSGEGEED
jgi:hypothetical protein